MVLTLVLIAGAGYTVQRYEELYTYEQLRRFFKNAQLVMAFQGMLFQDEVARKKLDQIKAHEGNRLPLLKDEFLALPEKHYADPFQPGNELLLLYGYVRHPVEIEDSYFNNDEPVWFTYSRGSGGAMPKLEITRQSGQRSEYRFLSQPFDISNGINSKGYIYYDSRGLRLGEGKY